MRTTFTDWALCQPLPISDFEWLKDFELVKDLEDLDVLDGAFQVDEGMILEVDLEVPKDRKFSDYPLAPEKL